MSAPILPPPTLPLERLLLIGFSSEETAALGRMGLEALDLLPVKGWSSPDLACASAGDALVLRAGALPPEPLPERLAALPWVALASPGTDPLELLRAGVHEVVTRLDQLPEALERAAARAGAPRPASSAPRAQAAGNDLFPNLYDWIYVVGIAEDGGQTFESVTPPLRAESGFLNPDFAGRSPSACLPPASAAALGGHLRRVLEDGQPGQFEEEHPAGEGRSTFQTTLTPIRNKWGRIHRIACISRDITALRKAEAALKASDERLAHALEGTQQGLWDWDLATGEVYRSQAWTAMLGYLPGEVGSTRAAGTDLTHPDDRALLQESLQAHLEGRSPRFQAEYRMKARNGDWVWIFDAGKVVSRDALGAPRRLAGLCTDITERRRAEESLRALVGGVVHEIRNPIYGILINLDALEVSFGAEARFRPFATALRESSTRIASLMCDLRDYGEPRVLNPEPCPVRALLEEALHDCGALALERTCQVRIRLAEPGLILPLQGRRMRQAFRNLLENALQHAPRGSAVTCSGGLQDWQGHPWWFLRISDEGPGFGAETLARAFEPFFTRRKGGTGLGLSIVKRVVEEHGGRVEAANAASGGGAVLTLRLPAHGTGLAGQSPASPSGSGIQEGRKGAHGLR